MSTYHVIYRRSDDEADWRVLVEATTPDEASLIVERTYAGHDDITITRVELLSNSSDS